MRYAVVDVPGGGAEVKVNSYVVNVIVGNFASDRAKARSEGERFEKSPTETHATPAAGCGAYHGEDKAAMEAALGCALVEADALGLCVGDLWNGSAWTRNVDGEQVTLPIEAGNSDAEDLMNIIEGVTE